MFQNHWKLLPVQRRIVILRVFEKVCHLSFEIVKRRNRGCFDVTGGIFIKFEVAKLTEDCASFYLAHLWPIYLELFARIFHHLNFRHEVLVTRDILKTIEETKLIEN